MDKEDSHQNKEEKDKKEFDERKSYTTNCTLPYILPYKLELVRDFYMMLLM